MHSFTRRSLLASATAGLVSPTSATEKNISEQVVLRAKYGGRDVAWEITLSNNYTAKFRAHIGGMTIGSITGEFRFYDTDVIEKEQLPRFFTLPKNFHAPTPSLHPWAYVIAMKNPTDGAFHEVSVWFARDMPRSDELRFFFEIWRNVWSGVPGYPRAPGGYAG
jgi:hypothetical protein